MDKGIVGVGLMVFLYIGAIVTAIAAWVTHVVVCIKAGLWGFLIAGAIFAPVGVIHGLGVWFHWWS